MRRLSTAEKAVILERSRAGVSSRQIARDLDRPVRTVQERVERLRRRPPAVRRRALRQLSVAEREEISRGLAQRRSFRSIAAGLGRSPSTVCREVARNGGRRRYRAARAEDRAWAHGRRPKLAKLAVQDELRGLVSDKLEQRWSPQQIAGWLRQEFPGRAEMQVSHETIYLALFVQGRGTLRKELHAYLRRGHATRRPRGYTTTTVRAGCGRSCTSPDVRPRPRTGQCLGTGKATCCWAPPPPASRRWWNGSPGS